MAGNFGNLPINIKNGSAPSTPSGGVVLYSNTGELSVVTPTTTVPLNSSCRVFTATLIPGTANYTPSSELLALIRTPGAPGYIRFDWSSFLTFNVGSENYVTLGIRTDQVITPGSTYLMYAHNGETYKFISFPLFATLADIADASNNTIIVYMNPPPGSTLAVTGAASEIYVEYYLS